MLTTVLGAKSGKWTAVRVNKSLASKWRPEATADSNSTTHRQHVRVIVWLLLGERDQETGGRGGEGGRGERKGEQAREGRRQKERLKSQGISVVPSPPQFPGQEKLSEFGKQEVTSPRKAKHRKENKS